MAPAAASLRSRSRHSLLAIAVLLTGALAGGLTGAGGALAAALLPSIAAVCDSGAVKVTGVNFFNKDANSLQIGVSRSGGEDVFPSPSSYFPFSSPGFTQSVLPSTRPADTYVVRASTFHPPSTQALETARTTIPLPCPTPAPSSTPTPPPLNSSLVCSPASAPPGSVVTAVGTGFPPAVAVFLAWKTGINANPQLSAVSDATGGFQVPVFLFPHDQGGPRTLAATPDPKVVEPAFKEVDGQCLVSLGSVQPRDFAWRR